MPSSALIVPTVYTVTPADAAVYISGQPVTDGRTTLPPGTHPVSVARRGFAQHSAPITVAPDGPEVDLTIRLTPKPQALSFTVQPPGAAWSLTTADGQTQDGTGDFTGEVLSGEVALTVTADGLQAETFAGFIDAPTHRSFWLDREGQVLSLIHI